MGVLVFITVVFTVLSILAAVSWLCVGTFWLLTDQPRLVEEYDEYCSLSIIVLVGVTVIFSWATLTVGGGAVLWSASRRCNWSQSQYTYAKRKSKTHVDVQPIENMVLYIYENIY